MRWQENSSVLQSVQGWKLVQELKQSGSELTAELERETLIKAIRVIEPDHTLSDYLAARIMQLDAERKLHPVKRYISHIDDKNRRRRCCPLGS